MAHPGPAALGRGVIINRGQPVPPAWRDAPVVPVDEATLQDPSAAVSILHRAWSDRVRVVIELGVDPVTFRTAEQKPLEPWKLRPSFEFGLDRLHFLVWANTYDARTSGARPRWWWGRKAIRLGASPLDGDRAGDVVLPDGRTAWIDGGPRAPIDPELLGGAVLVHRESVELGRLHVAPVPRLPTADLAADQLAAVAHQSGPARIIAPAGSGKTRVLTERLRHLMVDRGWERETILAVAYNKKAQLELEARCADIRPRAQTLNALGYQLLAGVGSGPPRILEESEVRSLIDRLAPARRRRVNTDPVAPYIEGLSMIRLGLVDPEDVESWRDDVPGLAALFPAYRTALRELGAVDFDEQIYAAVELLLADGPFRRRAQAGCRHLLVDEFQDLTPAHMLLLRLLAAPGMDVFGVGDDDQVIYGHAGADPDFLIRFDGLFPGGGDHPLEVNYRCPPSVVTAATHLLSYNDRRVSKTIRSGRAEAGRPDGGPVDSGRPDGGPVDSGRPDGGPVDSGRSDGDPAGTAASVEMRIIAHASGQGASAVVDVVRAWLALPGVTASQIAVLCRVNALLLGPHVALADAGVPLASTLRPEVLNRTGLRAALAYLRIATAEDGAISAADVIEVLRRPSRGLPTWFSDRLRRRSWWSMDALGRLSTSVPDKEKAKVDQLIADLAQVRRAATTGPATTASVLQTIKDGVGLGGAMSLLDTSRGGEGSSHLDDLEALEQVAALHDDPATFEAWLRRVFQREAAPEGVTLSTVHRVKGMEWDRVALFGTTAGIIPHRLSDDDEEERRVLHVAITRCRQEVVILTDAGRPSPMLGELDGSVPRSAGAEPFAGRSRTGTAVGGRPGAAARVGVGTRSGAGPGLAVGGPGVDDGGSRGGRSLTSPGGLRRQAAGAERARPSTEHEPLTGPAANIEQALRAWRRERCRRDKVSAFIVLYDRTLRAIAEAAPTSLVALRRIEGIGPTKLEQYGEEILSVVAAEAGSAASAGELAPAGSSSFPSAEGAP